MSRKPTLRQARHMLYGNEQPRKGSSRRYYDPGYGRRAHRAFVPIGTIVNQMVWDVTRPRDQRRRLTLPLGIRRFEDLPKRNRGQR